MTALATFATWREIHAQPALWREWGRPLTWRTLRAKVDALAVEEVWLCGAGSSAYLGEILAAGLEGRDGPRLRAIATTDIVARPRVYLRGRPRLVVSFGRSGNSAESIGTLQALEKFAASWPRVNITCNAQSALGQDTGAQVILMPEATHDMGFAMTSSFTTMYLTALALFDRTLSPAAMPGRFAALADLLDGQLARTAPVPPPERAVFVGSGALAYAAREAALKVMELSAGAIPALWDSTLGFRHGPKSSVRGKTGIWVFRSADALTRSYDDDLIDELKAQFPGAQVTVPDLPIESDDLWSAPVHIAMAQVLAVQWSAAMGLNVDDPFAGQGTLTRVVSGVRLHDMGEVL